jgi:hypothetical protein
MPLAGIAALPVYPLSACGVHHIGNLHGEKGMLDCRALDEPVVRGNLARCASRAQESVTYPQRQGPLLDSIGI